MNIVYNIKQCLVKFITITAGCQVEIATKTDRFTVRAHKQTNTNTNAHICTSVE